ncbi:prolipoprotein diacylglyceryl transferase [Blautia glucerasea]|uniref:prolipoprotein diacylglyceryl transferase n=1 Tax=Blautia glucerasea TaxID=536633 RepID=UPI001D02BE03|nr:prolipoprotein diacylglyceryl transferase [Blautia glucerasea]MCB5385649.1 prolipoprotein diacylglyceryl transferase [Blautia glucerasea]MCB5420312.1 prolipoprotein diacylglyceryl transferase [Blautia luti]
MSIQFPNLGINLDYVGKSIQIFGFEITFFGLIIALGMLLGLGFVILEAKRCGENKDEYLEMMIISLLFGVIGARLLYVACSWNLYKGNIVQIFNIRNGGLCFYGGLFGGMLGAAIYCGVRRKPFMQMADTASMGIIVAQIIGRWGDFFNRESFGEYTNSIFAMQLPLSAVRSSEVTSAMRENLETIGGTSYIQVHPTFFYESAWCLLLFLLMLVWKRKKCFQGQVFLRYLAGYGLGRFVIEYLRTDKLLIPGTSIGISQLISAALFLICALVAAVEGTMAKKRAARRRRRREQDYEAQERAAREAEAEEYRDRLRLERAFADEKAGEVPETYSGNTAVYESAPEEERENTSPVEEDASAEIYQDEEVPEEATEDEGPDGNASEENSPEEISEDEALPESEEPAQSVEDTVSASEKDTAVAKNPSFSEDDEWLYSKPRRFAKKPANQQED